MELSVNRRDKLTEQPKTKIKARKMRTIISRKKLGMKQRSDGMSVTITSNWMFFAIAIAIVVRLTLHALAPGSE